MTTIDLNAGALAPVAGEIDAVDLRVTGALARELNGVLVRNGPNPLRGRFDGGDVLSWWPQDAMLHAISFDDGRATRYRNRWARTRRWARVHDPAREPSLVLDGGSTQRYRVPPGDQNSEPVFVPRPGAAGEDDGWLLAYVYRHATDTSDVVILDGRSIGDGPIATVHLPRRVPAGFHGAWLPAGA